MVRITMARGEVENPRRTLSRALEIRAEKVGFRRTRSARGESVRNEARVSLCWQRRRAIRLPGAQLAGAQIAGASNPQTREPARVRAHQSGRTRPGGLVREAANDGVARRCGRGRLCATRAGEIGREDATGDRRIDGALDGFRFRRQAERMS